MDSVIFLEELTKINKTFNRRSQFFCWDGTGHIMDASHPPDLVLIHSAGNGSNIAE
jgi:hypothetical protein